MRAFAPAAIVLLCQSVAAGALQRPQPAVAPERGGDPHVRVAIYRPTEQVLLVGAVGRPVTITFGPEEHIRRVVLETSGVVDGKAVPAPWDGPGAEQVAQQPLGNVLPLWAMRAGRSNAQVITATADGGNRVYLFQLVALPPQPNECAADDCDDPRLTTGLSFVYPEEARAVSQQVARKTHAVSQRLAAEERLRQDIFYGQRNWKYVAKGTEAARRALAPDQISDNTQVTGLLYLGNRKAPALYIVEAGDSERQVTPTPDKDLLVVYETARHWRLRKGIQVLDLYNLGYDPIGANPWTGTTSPSVLRVTRQAEGSGR
jgi:type IV secretion system protein VirB9